MNRDAGFYVLLLAFFPSFFVLLLAFFVIVGIPTAFWDRIDGVSPAGSEAADAAPVVESPRTPAAGAVVLPDPVQEELALDCDPQEVAAAIAEARVYRESMAGRTAVGQSATSPLTYRTLHAVAAGALEAHIVRCLRFWEGR